MKKLLNLVAVGMILAFGAANVCAQGRDFTKPKKAELMVSVNFYLPANPLSDAVPTEFELKSWVHSRAAGIKNNDVRKALKAAINKPFPRIPADLFDEFWDSMVIEVVPNSSQIRISLSGENAGQITTFLNLLGEVAAKNMEQKTKAIFASQIKTVLDKKKIVAGKLAQAEINYISARKTAGDSPMVLRVEVQSLADAIANAKADYFAAVAAKNVFRSQSDARVYQLAAIDPMVVGLTNRLAAATIQRDVAKRLGKGEQLELRREIEVIEKHLSNAVRNARARVAKMIEAKLAVKVLKYTEAIERLEKEYELKKQTLIKVEVVWEKIKPLFEKYKTLQAKHDHLEEKLIDLQLQEKIYKPIKVNGKAAVK